MQYSYIALDCTQHQAMCCIQWYLMHGLLHKIQSYTIYMCARFVLTISSNWYVIAHTSGSSCTIEGLWLIELFSDTERQHRYCSICSWFIVFGIASSIDSSSPIIMPTRSGDTTHISKRFRADTKQIIVVAKAYFCLVCCQLKIVITICGGQI